MKKLVQKRLAACSLLGCVHLAELGLPQDHFPQIVQIGHQLILIHGLQQIAVRPVGDRLLGIFEIRMSA
ncbi:hypothetical protein D3C71_1510520 [compost metagenome]